MIYFVTNNRAYDTAYNKALFPDITVVTPEKGKELYKNLLANKKTLSLDIEATGLDAYTSDTLLVGIGSKTHQLMFDYTIDITDYIEDITKRKKVILGHNLKYDIKRIKVDTGITIRNVYDTMLAEQRIYLGLGSSNENPLGYKWGLADVIERRLKKAVLKATHMEFVGVDKKTFKIAANHLYYLRQDLIDLPEIQKQQVKQIKKYKMEYLIYGIEFPLIHVLALAELEGFDFDIDKWRATLLENKEIAFNLECKLDEIFRKLRQDKEFVIQKTKALITGGKWDNKRVKNSEYDLFNADGTMNTLNLFGEPTKINSYLGSKAKNTVKVKYNPNNVNYNSTKDVLQIFIGLQEPIITKNEVFKVPQLTKTGKVSIPYNDATFKEDMLFIYLEQKPDTDMKEFLETYMEYKKVQKAISTYGESFITYLNDVTGKLHTDFGQCFTATGRMSSGGGKKMPDKPNFQNIPADNRYRNCFTVDTDKYSVITADYSGAELIVMCSHAQDHKLLKLASGDMHSHMATICWRAIYAHRASKAKEYIRNLVGSSKHIIQKAQDKVNEYLKLSKEFVVTKIAPPGFRKDFKPMTFGVIYGLFAKKAGKTLKVPKEEGQIAINVIEREIPATIKMVKEASIFAEKFGYVVLNNRTNSRAWFPFLIKQLKGEISKDGHFMEISKDLSAARNKRIQGTQADFVKEAGVKLAYYIYKNDIDAVILSFVHDEIVTKCPKYLDGQSKQWKQWIKDNPEGLTSPFNGKTGYSFPQIKEEIMVEVANLYLNNVTIKVDYEIDDFWKK